MARHGVSNAERKRIAEALERAARSGERDAVRIVREVYESIKDLPPDEAVRVLREAMGPASDRIAASVISGYEAAAASGAAGAVRRLGGTDIVSARALRQRYEASGGLQLSARIHQRSAETIRGMEGAIRFSVFSGRGAMATAESLRDFRGAIPETQLTKLLEDLTRKARAAMAASGDPRALRAFAQSKATIDRYAAQLLRAETGMGAATEAAIDGIVKAVARNNEAAIQRAIHWWSYDKQAYHLRAIARTEIGRGYSEGFVANADVPWVVGFKWNVETGVERKRDICDVLGNQNLYGLGPGVYPFGKQPTCPAHTNCNCYFTEEIDERIGEDEQRPPAPPQRADATAKWLKSQPAEVQREILGVARYAEFRKTGVIPAQLTVR
jgi:hypothetical protein